MDEVIGSHVFVLWFRSNIPYNPLVAQALLNGLLACAYMASTWMLIYVTAQRFMVISRPLSFLSHSSLSVKKVPRSSAIRSVLRQIKIPCALSVVSALISFPCSFEWSFEVCIGQDSKEIEMVNPTSLMTNKSYIILYKTIILPLLQTFGPIVIISFLTIQTLKKMKRSMDRRALILIEQGKGSIFFSDRDKTKSLQLISSLLLSKFVILRCFPTVLEIFKLIQGNNVSGLTKFADLLIILNSATNSFVFVVVKAAFETRRLRKARERQRLFVAKTAEEIFRISRFLASDKTLLVPKNNNEDKQSLSVTTNSDETSS
uniref:G_PROTEIN_RECEP_F1_2 domain-containing protein n=1 Tax=Rhabditophanes sp. KR3021 TaxID=114890 RepID=A0AC35UD83_9BILA